MLFNYFSETLKNVENKIDSIIEEILNNTNTHLMPLIADKKDLI